MQTETVATVAEVNLFSPLSKDWGAAKSGWGKERNTPPVSFRLSLPGCTREAPRRMPRVVDSRKGETPDDIPMPARSGGWGVGVGVRESRIHGESSPWRRPLAWGVLAHEGVSRECAS